jgi:hypothetical protein
MTSWKFDEIPAATGANLVTQGVFRPRITPTENNLTPAKDDEALKSLPFTRTDLTTFHPRKLAPEIRVMIWKFAAEDIPGRAVCIQPIYDNTPGLINTWVKARAEGEKRFKNCKSTQESVDFRIFINYDKDILYLNHKFRNGKKCMNSVLQAAIQVYPSWMMPVQNLAITGDH